MSVDLVVVHCPVGGGHKAAAFAVAEAARMRGLSVAIVDAFAHAPKWAGDAYVNAHLTGQNALPDLYGEMFFRANHRGGVLDPVRLRWDTIVFGGLRARIAELDPSAIVATHHLPLVVLGRERRKGRLDAPVVGVVTDYIAHACWAERGVDAWAVPTVETAAEMIAHGADRSEVVVTGIPVRAAFARIAPVLPRRDGRISVLATSGGFGVGPMARIVASFRGVPDVDVTVVCGNAKRIAAPRGVRATILGFEKNMPARVAAADVVVGKAGGLTVTETLTAGRPMVIASAIPGNEAVNAAFVEEGGAGVCAEPDHVGETIDRLRARGCLRTMGRAARALVPRDAAGAVVDVAVGLSRRRFCFRESA
jgi:processive 1,2-diacylglycerol beta-glucosyltransferase